MRNRGALVIAVVIAAVLAVGSGVALVKAGDDSSPNIGALPTASPSPTETTSPTPSPTPSETPSETPSASPTPTETSTATQSATPRPTSTRTSGTASGPYSYPKPTRSYEGLQLTITATSQDTDPLLYTLKITAQDQDGTIYLTALSWGDGATEPAERNPQSCKSYPNPPTSPQGAYRPQTDENRYTFQHRYVPGSYVITVKVASVNVDCRPNGPKREDRVLRVRVNPPSPGTPSPTPAA